MVSSADLKSFIPENKLKILPFNTFSGSENMAIDYSIALKCNELKTPVLRFYGWQPACLSLGKHQNVKLVDTEQLSSDKLHLVRRPTGGSAILHDDELTYSLIVPNGNLNHHEIYHTFHTILSEVFLELNYPINLHNHKSNDNYLKDGYKNFACFNRPAFTEIKWQNKKIVGSAQKLFSNGLLQHGSILIKGRQSKVLKYLKMESVQKEKIEFELDHSSAALSDIDSNAISKSSLSGAIIKQFAKYGVNLIYSDYVKEELLPVKQDILELFDIK